MTHIIHLIYRRIILSQSVSRSEPNFPSKNSFEKVQRIKIHNDYDIISHCETSLNSETDILEPFWTNPAKGVDIFNREYPPGVFLRGLKIFAEKIRGLNFFGTS